MTQALEASRAPTAAWGQRLRAAEDLERLLHILGTTIAGVELALSVLVAVFTWYSLGMQERARIAMASWLSGSRTSRSNAD